MSSHQLSLPVSIKETATFESFVNGENKQIIHYLQDLVRKPLVAKGATWLTYLCGEEGLGKSHLLYAICQLAEQQGLNTVYLSFRQYSQLSTEVLRGLEHSNLICLDDIEWLTREKQWQIALFDLINRVKEAGIGRLLIAGKLSINQLPLELPDLKSRLAWGVAFKLRPLGDEDRQRVLDLKAGLRGINMSKDVSKFLINHWQRDMHSLIKSLDILDEQSLKYKRKLTIPFVKEILGI